MNKLVVFRILVSTLIISVLIVEYTFLNFDLVQVPIHLSKDGIGDSWLSFTTFYKIYLLLNVVILSLVLPGSYESRLVDYLLLFGLVTTLCIFTLHISLTHGSLDSDFRMFLGVGLALAISSMLGTIIGLVFCCRHKKSPLFLTLLSNMANSKTNDGVNKGRD